MTLKDIWRSFQSGWSLRDFATEAVRYVWAGNYAGKIKSGNITTNDVTYLMQARKVTFYRNGDQFFKGLTYAIKPQLRRMEQYKAFEHLLADVSRTTLRSVFYSSPLRSAMGYLLLEVDRISASVSVSAPNVDRWALSADIRFRPKAVVPHSVHFRFRRAAVGKFGGCQK